MKRHLKDYFIPHEGNEYQPQSLRKAACVGMTAMILLSFTVTNLQSLLWISSDWLVSTILPAVVVDLTNEERADFALSNLRRNSTLDEAARLKAEHMAANEYFSHYSPDGVSPWYWFNQTNYSFVHAGENLAVHFTDSDEVVDAWMNSPSHRENILNGNYTEIGVGAAAGSYEGFKTVYVVQLFGTPAAASQPVVVTPPAIVTQSQPVVSAETETTAQPSVVPLPPEEIPITESVPTPVPVQDPATQQIAGSDEVIDGAEDGTVVSLGTSRDPVMVISSSTQTATETVEIAAVEINDDESVSLYSGFISTSTGGIPATTEPGDTIVSKEAPTVLAMATQPQLVLQILYTIIGAFVLIALILSVQIEWQRHHRVQVAYSAGLMATMLLLFYVHVVISAGALIV